MKRLNKVKKTRKEHFCLGCEKKIKRGSSAINIITGATRHLDMDIHYFHNINCYNEWEAKNMESEE